MVQYHCERCGYATILKSNIRKHCERVTECEPIIDDVEVNFEDMMRKQDPVQSRDYLCSFCHKSFAQACSLSRHKKMCKERHESIAPVVNNKQHQ
jgi:hypothetical protein